MSGGFYSVHPLPALIYYAGAILLIFLFDHPLFLVTSCLSALLIWRLVDPHSEKRRFLISYLFMASMVIILNPLFNHRGATILFYLFDQHITLEATVYGLLMGVILLSVFITFQSFNRILSADKMIYLFVPVLPRSTLVFAPGHAQRTIITEKIETYYACPTYTRSFVNDGVTPTTSWYRFALPCNPAFLVIGGSGYCCSVHESTRVWHGTEDDVRPPRIAPE